MRSPLRFAEFDFEVRCKMGRNNQRADALSRLLRHSETIPKDDDDDIFTIDVADLDDTL